MSADKHAAKLVRLLGEALAVAPRDLAGGDAGAPNDLDPLQGYLGRLSLTCGPSEAGAIADQIAVLKWLRPHGKKALPRSRA